MQCDIDSMCNENQYQDDLEPFSTMLWSFWKLCCFQVEFFQQVEIIELHRLSATVVWMSW